jgi:hypothetical protein
MWFGVTRVLVFIALLGVWFVSGCVTRTERVYPHEQPPWDESVWDEIRREFGWRDDDEHTSTETPSTPLHQRVVQGVKGWFGDDPAQFSEEALEADRRRFERKRAQALEQLRDQQELDGPAPDD